MSVTAPSASLSSGEQAISKVPSTQPGTIEANRPGAHIVPNHLDDTIALSLMATARLVMDAPNIAAGQLGSLLQEFDRPTQSATPHAIGELAAKIGMAADALGNSISVLLPSFEATLPRPIEPVTPIVYTDGALLITNAVPTIVDQPKYQHADVQEPGLQTPAGQELKAADVPTAMDPRQEMRDTASSILRDATIILERMQHYLHEIDTPQHRSTVFGQDYSNSLNTATLNDTKIALAQSQVAHAEHLVAGVNFDKDIRDQRFSPMNQLKVKSANHLSSSRIRLELISGMLCLTLLWWLTSKLDLRVERVAAAVLVVISSMIWGSWKIAQWKRLRLELWHQAEQ